jgi:hypothetical protein
VAKLQTVADSLDTIPEETRDFYVEKEGRYVLQIEGAPPDGYATAADLAAEKGRVIEFRDSKVGLLKGLAEILGMDTVEGLDPLRLYLKKFEGVDPTEYHTLKSQAAELGDKGVKKADDIETLVNQAVSTQLSEAEQKWQARLEAESTARQEAERKADLRMLDKVIGNKLSGAKAKSDAMDFLLDKAQDIFEVKDGQVTAKDGRFSPKNATDPLSVEEWVTGALTDWPFAFEASKGGGAETLDGPGGPAAGVEVLQNPTSEQLGDPKIAEKLREGKLVIR